jgi:hypothetical protein
MIRVSLLHSWRSSGLLELLPRFNLNLRSQEYVDPNPTSLGTEERILPPTPNETLMPPLSINKSSDLS